MILDNESEKERNFTFFVLEVELFEFVIDALEKLCENMNCIFCSRVEIDDVIGAYPMERIGEGAIFCVTDAHKADSVVFFYRKSSGARRRIFA